MLREQLYIINNQTEHPDGLIYREGNKYDEDRSGAISQR